MNKSIFEKQNDDFILKCLALQRIKYSEAKKYLNHKNVLTFLYAIVSIAGTVIDNDVSTAFVNLFSLILLLYSGFCDKRASHLADLASEIQKYVDVVLYTNGQNKNWEMLGRLLSREELEQEINQYNPLNTISCLNWYRNIPSNTLEEQIYHCQKENIQTDGRLKNHYLIFLISSGVIGISIIMAFLISFYPEITALRVFYFFIWSVPVFSYIYNLCLGIISSLSSLKSMQNICCQIENHLRDNDLEAHKNLLVDLQEKIQKNRKILSFVPDWFFRIDNDISKKIHKQSWVRKIT